MRPTGDMRPPRRGESGFTLLELLVVLVVIALIATLAAPRLGAVIPGVTLDRAAATIEARFGAARSEALRTSRVVVVVLDAGAGSVGWSGGGAGGALDLPDGVALRLPDGARRQAIAFHPDGSSSGGAFRLASGGRTRAVAVDWFDGRVTGDARASD